MQRFCRKVIREKPCTHRSNPQRALAVLEKASGVMGGEDIEVLGVEVVELVIFFVIDNQSVVAAKKIFTFSVVEEAVTSFGGRAVAEVAAWYREERFAVDVNLEDCVFFF